MSEMATLIPPGGLPSPTASKKTFGVEALNMTKRFGEFAALDAGVAEGAARHVPCAARRERRRQVDARQVHHGLLPGR